MSFQEVGSIIGKKGEIVKRFREEVRKQRRCVDAGVNFGLEEFSDRTRGQEKKENEKADSNEISGVRFILC